MKKTYENKVFAKPKSSGSTGSTRGDMWVLGDDGASSEIQEERLIKETDSTYSIWCSGRAGCSSMLVKLNLLKRQDLVSVMSLIMKPKHDQVVCARQTYAWCRSSSSPRWSASCTSVLKRPPTPHGCSRLLHRSPAPKLLNH